jgi:hypothetical protein
LYLTILIGIIPHFFSAIYLEIRDNKAMIWRGAMKYPVLIMGIIMFILFISNEKTKIWWNQISMRYIPSTCKSIESRIKTKAPDHWKIYCSTTEDMVVKVKFKDKALDNKNTRSMYYRALANELKTFALFANPETLVHLDSLKLYLKGKELRILAKTDGEALVRLREIKDKDIMAKHLKLTVKVKELTESDQ